MSLPVARLSAAQSSAFERCAAIAARRALRVLGRGVAKVEPFVGCPVWLVSSSRPGHASHLVWLFRGHLLCNCEAGQHPERAITCSHAALVRLSLAERAAVPASVPVPPSASHSEQAESEAGGSSAGPVPPPPPCPPCPICAHATTRTAAGALVCPTCGQLCADDFGPLPPNDEPPPAHCPRCGLPVDPDELAQLGGECLDCLLDMRPAHEPEARDQERKSSAAEAIVARERARQERYRTQGRSAATDIRRDPSWQPERDLPATVGALADYVADQLTTRLTTPPTPTPPGAAAPIADRPAFSVFK